MPKFDEKTLEQLESQYPGIREQIARHDSVEIPACPHCGSDDTAIVHVGMVGRSIQIAGATTKFALVPNSPAPGTYRCNACKGYFG